MTAVAAAPQAGWSGSDFLDRARRRLDLSVPAAFLDHTVAPVFGDHRVDGVQPSPGRPLRAAAVLLGVIEHPEGATLLMTLRAAHLRDHSGQIALPGGKIDPGDASPAAAALREAQEEVGLDPARVEPLGYLDAYLTGTGFLIVPTVAIVTPPLTLQPNAAEVDDVFEVPMSFLMDQANHGRGTRALDGRTRSFYVMAYGERRIWGVTAGVIRSLYERLYT